MTIRNKIMELKSSDSPRDRAYSMILWNCQAELGSSKAQKMLDEAEKSGRFVTMLHEDPDIMDGGEFVVSEIHPYDS